MKPIFEEERVFFKNKTGINLPKNCWRHGSKIYLDCTKNEVLIQFKVENKKIKIKKNNLEKTNISSQLKIEDLINFYEKELDLLFYNSKNKLIDYINNNSSRDFVVSISGGKDSDVLFYIFKECLKSIKSDINYIYNFANTSNETADTYKHVFNMVKKHDEKLNILNPQKGFYQWIKDKNYFIPSIMVRNCCSTYKEGQINKEYDKNKNISMIVGVRKSESSKRSKYQFLMDYDFNINLFGKSNFPKNWETVAPIVDWDDRHIWLFILKNNIKYNNQYNVGFDRCGCLWCPFQKNYTDLLIEEFYPKQYLRWMKVLEKNYKNTDVESRLKWSLDEWKSGKWKQSVSKESELIKLKPNKERIEKLSKIKNISYELAEKYFNKKCFKCDKKLNPDEVAINLKFYGRNMDISKMQCKKCFMKEHNMNRKEYSNLIKEFRNSGCNLF